MKMVKINYLNEILPIFFFITSLQINVLMHVIGVTSTTQKIYLIKIDAASICKAYMIKLVVTAKSLIS